MQYAVGRSKSGLPTVNEDGGNGHCQLVCGASGQRIKPIHVLNQHSANLTHAIFVAKVGMCLVVADSDRVGERVVIKRILRIGNGDNLNSIVSVPVGEYYFGGDSIPKEFQAVKMKALEKSRCYHCREAHYTI